VRGRRCEERENGEREKLGWMHDESLKGERRDTGAAIDDTQKLPWMVEVVPWIHCI
jgi:hypothetical protein